MNDCVFCKIVNGDIPSTKVMETENVISFNDIHPSSDVHILIVPKEHKETFMDIASEDKDLVSEMFEMGRKIIDNRNLSGKYRIVFNGGSLQVVPHLHMHLQAGEIKSK